MTIAAALGIVGGGCSGPEVTGQPSRPGASAAGAAESLPADPCSVVDETLVTMLAGPLAGSEVETISETYPSEPRGYCNRYFADQTYALDVGDAHGRRVVFDLYLYDGKPAEPYFDDPALTAIEEARRKLASLATSRELAPAEGDLRSIGDEVASGYNDPGEGGFATGEAVFRSSNLVVWVLFGGTDAAAGEAEVVMDRDVAVDGARQLARSISQNLQQ